MLWPVFHRATFFAEHFIVPHWVSPRAQVVLDAAVDFKLSDRDTLDDLRDEIRALLMEKSDRLQTFQPSQRHPEAPPEPDEG